MQNSSSKESKESKGRKLNFVIFMKDNISLGGKVIGKGKPCFIIAEAGVNHNGDIRIAKQLVDAAKEAEADAVKFQTFKSENLVTSKASIASYQKKNLGKDKDGEQSQLEMLKKLELSNDDFNELKVYCDKRSILFLSTPHTEDAADFLYDLVPAYKVGSGDLTNLPFLGKLAKKGKPLLLATGMSTMQEVEEAYTLIKEAKCPVVVLHCTSNYPCDKKDANLKAMKTMEKKLGCLVGYSDHTLGIEISIMAASLGAVVVEKHFTLDKNMEGPDHKASIDPKELKELVKAIRENRKINILPEIMGDGVKRPTEAELKTREIVRKSIVAKIDIKNGQKIKEDMLIIKRPGTGIEPKQIKKLIGKSAFGDIKKDELIRWEQVR